MSLALTDFINPSIVPIEIIIIIETYWKDMELLLCEVQYLKDEITNNKYILDNVRLRISRSYAVLYPKIQYIRNNEKAKLMIYRYPVSVEPRLRRSSNCYTFQAQMSILAATRDLEELLEEIN